ncbi:hypothetical protein IVB25_35465 [Bradyrhizobium sp. 193]|uniref:hypothetical protein n=1 Tax=Bradyrhizobium sp. 193 TaxID=2782661 RepID=UPI001FF7922E|nr:hypothetical protein [Bradyrhizobium sp. 193]MCK1487836.1 hypothetical protein [Bradyrhizobium sp. 193]
MDLIFQRFAERLTESTHEDAAQQSMAEVAAALELSCYAYLTIPRAPGCAPKLMSTYRKRDFLRTVTPALLTDGLRIEGGI